MDCFRHAEPGARQQGEESVVGVAAKGVAFTQPRGGLENTLDFLRRKNVGYRSRPAFTAKDCGRNFVVCIFRTNVPRKSNHLSKSARSLTERRCGYRPLDGGFSADIALARSIGERGEALQQATFGPKREPGSAA